MSQITANALQIVQPNQSVVFTDGNTKKCCTDIIHRNGSSVTTLKSDKHNCYTKYRVTVSANVSIPATVETPAPITMSLAENGDTIPESTMIVTPANASEFFNISKTIEVYVPNICCESISFKNLSTIPVAVQNAVLVLERIY